MARRTSLLIRDARRPRRAATYLLGLAAVLLANRAVAAGLPTVCAPCAGNVSWRAPGSTSTYTVNGAHGVVAQRGARETFNWASFDIGRGKSLEFRQPSSTAIALNRIHDASPSEIFGALKANGQIYLINQNGVLFKPGAQVDVNTLLASSLDLNDAVDKLFESVGITNAFAQSGNPPALVANGTPGPITVERGASITTGRNGRAILVGGDVTNAGTINVSGLGGQALLVAAGESVYLLSSSEKGVRGLAVEINGGGTVANLGRIIAAGGNVTLAGLAVNQDGVVRASTAVAANGSIRLQARDTVSVTVSGGVASATATRAGTVKFGARSTTEILPDTTDTATAVDDLEQLPSRIAADAKDIDIEGGAQLRATGGQIALRASGNPNAALGSGEGSIHIARNAVLDVSGSEVEDVPVTRFARQIELRGNELADAPAQRGGPLFGQTITFDARNPPSIAKVDAAIANLGRTVAERTTAGGEITLNAGADVHIDGGALLDVSGGSVSYTGGFFETTKLIKDGVLVDIANADPRVRYDAVLGPVEFTHPKWGPDTTESFLPFGAASSRHYETGYVEGKDAGAITIAGLSAQQVIAVDVAGTFRARTLRGVHQREMPGTAGGLARPYDEVARGGSLALQAFGGALTYRADGGWPFLLDGIDRLSLAVDNFALEPGARLSLAPGGALDVRAEAGATLGGVIRIVGGEVSVAVNDLTLNPSGLLEVTPGARIDVSGGFVNDSPVLHPAGNDEARFIDGGAITLSSSGTLRLARGSTLDVDGGLALDRGGRRDAGAGGSITLAASLPEGVADSASLELGAQLSGYVFAGQDRRSRLSISAPGLLVASGGTHTDAGLLTLGTRSLLSGGFTDLVLSSNAAGIDVAPGTQLDLLPAYRNLRAQLPGARPYRSTTRIGDISEIVTLDDAEMRSPSSITLAARPYIGLVKPAPGVELAPVLSIGAGARLATEAEGSITLSATGTLDVEGSLLAPAGSLRLDVLQRTDTGAPDRTIGFDPARALYLGPQAALDVAGVAIAQPLSGKTALFGANALVSSTPLAGGDITLSAAEAYVLVAPGARLDVSGARGERQSIARDARGVPALTSVATASDAGSIDVAASNGIRLFGSLRGAADTALGASGGRLAIDLDGGLRKTNAALLAGAPVFPETPLSVRVGAAEFGVGAPGEAIDTALFGRAEFDLGGLRRGGFGDLALVAAPNEAQRGPNTTVGVPVTEARIDFIGDVTLELANALTLDAPIIASDGGVARLSADYLRVGFSRDFVTSDQAFPVDPAAEPAVKFFAATSGTGGALFRADVIDLVGYTTLRGFGGDHDVRFVSHGDLRVTGVRSPARAVAAGFDGALVAASDLTLSGARIYPTTLTSFAVLDQAAGATLRFASPAGADSATPLSAAGSLRGQADNIVQAGNLMAPHGQLTLDADHRLTLAPGSLTSTSGGDATILFGRTEVGDWIFPLGSSAFVYAADGTGSDNRLALPEKRVTLVADGLQAGRPVGRVDVARGALIDVLGGGHLVATEFLPGPGGSSDLLDAAAALDGDTPTRFAIVPSETLLAPLDPLESPDFAVRYTRQVEIRSDVGALRAGRYAVLPPRYALLPGAFLFTANSSGSAALDATGATAQGLATADQLPLVAADLLDLGTRGAPAIASQYYQVESGAQVRQRAEYRESEAGRFFTAQAQRLDTAQPLLPIDAGAVTLAPNAALTLGGSLATARASAGRGTRVDIAATDLFVSNDGSGGTGVNVRADGLAALQADSLFLGGTRTATATETTIDQLLADTVVIDRDVHLRVPQLLLGALDRVEIRAGADLRGEGGSGNGISALNLAGEGAVLRLADSALPELLRTDVPAVSSAVLDVQAGARLFASGSLIADSSGETLLDGSIGAGAGGGIRIGARQIALGAPAAGAPGLHLDAGRLSRLGVGELLLSALESVDLYGDFTLDLDRLRIDAPGLRGMADGANQPQGVVRATRVVLGNSLGGLMAASGTGAGSLLFTSRSAAGAAPLEVELASTAGLDPTAPEDGDLDLSGFDEVRFDAPVVAASADHHLSTSGDLVIAADTLGARDRAHLELDAAGRLVTRVSSATASIAAPALDFLGGHVSLSGDSLRHDTRVLAPSGTVALTARGGDLVLGAHGAIDAGGLSDLDFHFARFGTPGGDVTLSAQSGDLRLDGGARIAVDGGTGRWNSDAGRMRFSAVDGTIDIAADVTLSGRAADDADGSVASFDSDALGGGGFTAINALLDSGAVHGARAFRVRGADGIEVAAGTTVRAGDIALTADGGAIDIAGTLDASGARGGRVRVAAQGGVTLAARGRIAARASGAYQPDPLNPVELGDGFHGGQVELAAPGGALDLAGEIDVTGQRVDARGRRQDDASGIVRLTAQRLANADVDIDVHGARVRGAADLQVIGHRVYDSTAVGTVVSDSAALAAAAPALEATLDIAFGFGADSPLRVAPGVEIASTSAFNATVPGTTSAINGLFASSIGAGVLTFRSAADLTVASNVQIRDGIVDQLVDGGARRYSIADSNYSWTLQFVAGADLASADLLATADSGTLRVNSGASIMTGSGDINLAAAGDITLATNAKVLVVGRHYRADELPSGVEFDGTINIPTNAILNFNVLRGVSFPDVGGSVRIAAGGSLVSAPSSQFASDWMVRIGGRDRAAGLPLGTIPRAWGLAIGPASVGASGGSFNQGIGAWGGGNITVDVGGNVSQADFSLPTVGRQLGQNSWPTLTAPWATTTDVVDEIGGGVLRVRAGGDILGTRAFVARGEADLRAVGDIAPFSAGTLRQGRYALGDSELHLQALGAVDVGAVVNWSTLSTKAGHPNPTGDPLQNIWLSYSPAAGVRVEALGAVSFTNQTGLGTASPVAENLYPARLEALSADGDVVLDGVMRLFGNATDGFVIGAAGGIGTNSNAVFEQVDLRPSSLPSLAAPVSQGAFVVSLANITAHDSVPVYAGADTANVLIARDGDIAGLQLSTAARLLEYAGHDIRDPFVTVQQPNPGDLSVFEAGHDILMSPQRSPAGALQPNAFQFVVAGPGAAHFIAGGRIDLGTATGIQSIGNLGNPALAEHGADLTLLAGIGDSLPGLLDFAIANYFERVLLPFNDGSAVYGTKAPLVSLTEAELAADTGIGADERAQALADRARRLRRLEDALGVIDRERGVASAKARSAVERLRSLADAEQLDVMLDTLYEELRLSGLEAASADSGHTDDFRRGYAAIEAMFPGRKPLFAPGTKDFARIGYHYEGDIVSTLSSVQTQDGGSLRVAAPGGAIDVGATANDAIAKEDKELGYIVFRGGDIKAFVRDDFNVNSTRVFAQNGGDVLIWSSTGDIDAGRGAKTAASIPATVAVFDEFGNYVDEPPLAVSGSGIRNFAPAGVRPGTLYLFAPQGVINAGDAGIGSAGNLVIAANEILGADNFDVGGNVTGSLGTDTGGISVGLTGVGDVAASASKAAEQATSDSAQRSAAEQGGAGVAAPVLSMLSVEVLGFGDESGGDESDESDEARKRKPR